MSNELLLIKVFEYVGFFTLTGIVLWIGIKAWTRFIELLRAHILFMEWAWENKWEFWMWARKRKEKKKEKERGDQ